jgi:hypothetical protein
MNAGKTNPGMPDIYWAKDDECGWIELKVVKQTFTGTATGIVWQDHQQVWMKEHNDIVNCCRTLIAYKDCFVLLTMDRFYESKDPLINYTSAVTLKGALLG